MSLDLLRSRKLSAANTNVTGIRNPAVPIPIEYLVVAGGGNGGNNYDDGASGIAISPATSASSYGSGGGGGGWNNNSNANSGAGFAGLVIVRYLTGTVVATGGNVTKLIAV